MAASRYPGLHTVYDEEAFIREDIRLTSGEAVLCGRLAGAVLPPPSVSSGKECVRLVPRVYLALKMILSNPSSCKRDSSTLPVSKL